MNKNKKVPNPIDVYVGSRIRLRRTMARMSQGRLAEMLGITFQQVQKYEKGVNRVGASRLQHISEILNVPIGFFFRNESENKSEEINEALDISVFFSSKDVVELNRAFASIQDPSLRECILELTRSISNVS